MPIIFENEVRKKKRRKGLAVFATVATASAIAIVNLPVSNAESSTAPEVERPHDQAVPSSELNGAAVNSPPTPSSEKMPGTGERSTNAPAALECSVTDGDTLKCGGRSIRLLGIDAPELPGHCRTGRKCVEGDPFAASHRLQQHIDKEEIQIVVVGRDRYGRELANVYANRLNVACDMISSGHAVYVEKWDDGGLVKADCPQLGL